MSSSDQNPYSPPEGQTKEPREPPRVKYWGMFWITPVTYYTIQVAVIALAVIVFLFWYLYPASPQLQDTFGYRVFPWIIGIGIVAEVIELGMMKKKFQQADEK